MKVLVSEMLEVKVMYNAKKDAVATHGHVEV